MGGLHRPEVACFCFSPRGPTIDYRYSQKNYFDVAEIYQWRWLEESGQRLENVDQSHLVLASGKLVLQKTRVQSIGKTTTSDLSGRKKDAAVLFWSHRTSILLSLLDFASFVRTAVNSASFQEIIVEA